MEESAYSRILEGIFKEHYRKGQEGFEFDREEIARVAKKLKVARPKNLGDVVYSYRYRRTRPEAILATCPEDKEWIIRGKGQSRYRFALVPRAPIEPRIALVQIKVPDATPEIVGKYAQSDEQALLAKLRYNRLIDIFAGITTYSLQNHLRTKIAGQQIETDEVYVGVGKSGAQYVLPVQAKGASDKLGRVQLEQDLDLCQARFPHLVCRAIAAQSMRDDAIAMFELTIDKQDRVQILEERQYRLVPSDEISAEDLDAMRREVR